MSRITRTVALGLLAAGAIATGTTVTPAQVPEEFTNLRVLPADISKRELMGIMRAYSGALDVRCNHCHVGPADLQGMDFTTDEKATKKTARLMMKMVKAINGTHLAAIDTGRSGKVDVRCQTCHHGLAVPAPIEEVLAHSIDADGVDAAITEYRQLRQEHYGGASYDFSQNPVNALAETLVREEKLDEALALMTMNIEFNPDEAWTRMLMAGVHKARGDKKKAIASYQAALRIEPDNGWAQRQIDALKAEGK